MCLFILKRHVVCPPVSLSIRLSVFTLFISRSLASGFHERSKAYNPVSLERAMGARFCLLTQISQSLSDNKKQQLCDCWEKEMPNNWEIKCLKRLYYDKPPPANFISYSALCLPHSPSPLIRNRFGSALHQQQPIYYTRLQDQISPKPC